MRSTYRCGTAVAALMLVAACSSSKRHAPGGVTTTTASSVAPAGPTSSASSVVPASSTSTASPLTVGANGKVPPCLLFSQAQASSLFGQPAAAGKEQDQPNGPLTVRSCTWNLAQRPRDASQVMFVTVSIIQALDATGQLSPKQYFEESRSAHHDAASVPGLGDQAFSAAGNLIVVLKGGTEIAVLVNNVPEPLQAAQTAAREALAYVK